MATRVGIGYDIHPRAADRTLVLGGVEFPGEAGLEGHSDADVLVHAIGDALLGSLALGDLGRHFPPGDPRWKGASSLDLLRLIRAMLDGMGAEAPKLAPLRDAMCANIARALRVGISQVSIKATTNEGLGAVGRGEGIAAMAVATVEASSS